MDAVHSMTDVTGFGLLGHLIEMADGSGLSAEIDFNAVPLITDLLVEYVANGCVPGGTNRNWDSYGQKVNIKNSETLELQKNVLSDPQTSGGLLVAVDKSAVKVFQELMKEVGLGEYCNPIGRITKKDIAVVTVV
jgi:selenide,water dikinase